MIYLVIKDLPTKAYTTKEAAWHEAKRVNGEVLAVKVYDVIQNVPDFNKGQVIVDEVCLEIKE